MRLRFVRVLCAAGLWLSINNLASAQDGYHQLTVEDFRGSPRPGDNNAIAHTKCSINFHYEGAGQGDNFKLNFDVRLTVDRDRSWIDRKRVTDNKQLARILSHEQGHYTISYMEQQELMRMINRTRFDENYYRSQASDLFSRIHAKYQQLNANYDLDTQNMRDKIQQHSWDVYFQKRVEYMPPIAKVGY
ncbi:MAG: hypothetical protein JWQ34_381 [Mucilaginibacter sp.]|uniref:DUF922 domain-containing protein n=1 Tax=Mucilaginibacter sp. TaxID=1882438 RepID=UPI002631C793|nr:hypothetical protein [Mucilaginibacter sp.]MDB5002156.1 hypothetical protein [Mucilaginibacter sp.]